MVDLDASLMAVLRFQNLYPPLEGCWSRELRVQKFLLPGIGGGLDCPWIASGLRVDGGCVADIKRSAEQAGGRSARRHGSSILKVLKIQNRLAVPQPQPALAKEGSYFLLSNDRARVLSISGKVNYPFDFNILREMEQPGTRSYGFAGVPEFVPEL